MVRTSHDDVVHGGTSTIGDGGTVDSTICRVFGTSRMSIFGIPLDCGRATNAQNEQTAFGAPTSPRIDLHVDCRRILGTHDGYVICA